MTLSNITQPATASNALAVVRTIDELRAMFRARVAALDLSYETVDMISGLPAGYTAKLLGPTTIRRFGPVALEALIGACALKLVVVEDAEAMLRLKARFVARRRALSVKRAGPGDVVVTRDREFMQRIGQFGGFASAQKRNASARAAISDMKRRAALHRWHPAAPKN